MQIGEYVKLVFISLFLCLKVYEWVQNGSKEATFTGTSCGDPNSARRREHGEEISRKDEDLLNWCEVQFAMPEIASEQEKKMLGRPRRTSPGQHNHFKLFSLHDRRKSTQQLTNEMRAGLNINI